MTQATVATWEGYVATKHELIRGLTGTVLELGAGRGANFGLLSPAVSWIGLEPNARSRRALSRSAAASGLQWQVLAATAERIPLSTAGWAIRVLRAHRGGSGELDLPFAAAGSTDHAAAGSRLRPQQTHR